jgi:16S rRNA (cytosine1402-N4)-methyltransferase
MLKSGKSVCVELDELRSFGGDQMGKQNKRQSARGTLVRRNEQVPFAGDKKDRFQGAGIRAFGFSNRFDPAKDRRFIRVSGFCVSGDVSRRSRDFGALRAAYRSRGSVFDGSQQNVTAYSRRWGLYEARWRRAVGGERFHSGFRQHYRSCDLCGSRRSFSALGTVSTVEGARRNPTRAIAGIKSILATFNLRRGNGILTDFDDEIDNVEGGPDLHIPVLLSEVLNALEPSADKVIFDGTFGAGGYSRAIMEAGAKVIATDQDPDVIANSKDMQTEFGDQLSLHHAKFSQILDFIEEDSLDGFVLDVGVSSMQIDQAERGFSFMQDGPLDMRMSQDGPTAADVVNQLKWNDLARIFGFYGEEKKAGRIARAIEAARLETPFTTTGQLAKLIANTVPRRASDRIHPATRVFQALRIYINNELGELALALLAAEKALKPGGVLVVVSFHSLEDRIVKKFFTQRFGRVSGSRHLPQVEVPDASFNMLGKKAMIAASKAEADINPRSRSAKLRAGLRTDAKSGSQDMKLFGLPNLYPLRAVARNS